MSDIVSDGTILETSPFPVKGNTQHQKGLQEENVNKVKSYTRNESRDVNMSN